jgi:hypothetical protein
LEEAASILPRQIQRRVFPAVVDKCADRAGEGFPAIYREHLWSVIRSLPVSGEATSSSVVISFNLSRLGSAADYERGFHHNAIIDGGTGKFQRYPAKVQFPPGYMGQKLLIDDDRRAELWEDYIATGGGVHSTGVGSGTKGSRGGEDYVFPSFEEVAEARVQLWSSMNVAPEWHILEYGTAETSPYSGPTDFLYQLETTADCYVQQYLDNIVEAAVEASNQGARLSTTYSGTRAVLRTSGGQFFTQKNLSVSLNPKDVDIWRCI